MIHVTCRLTAKNRDQLRNLMLGNRVCATFTSFTSPVTLPQLYHYNNIMYRFTFSQMQWCILFSDKQKTFSWSEHSKVNADSLCKCSEPLNVFCFSTTQSLHFAHSTIIVTCDLIHICENNIITQDIQTSVTHTTPWVKKKQDTKLLAITSLTIIRFSKFFSVADSAVNLQQIRI